MSAVHPGVIPMLAYQDGFAAMDWLSRASGYREKVRMAGKDGRLVSVPDVDAHYRRAQAAGATILSEPEDGFPARRYRAEDLEGHRWMFMARPAPAGKPTPAGG
jgi:uncharacterized glyoxalase superfamily protein PhnB